MLRSASKHSGSPLLWSVQLYSQLSSLISFGAGAPFPVSRSDFKLSRTTAHLVLQWCMNSTGSFQPWCLKRMMVQSPSCLRSKFTFVPIHSSGPSTTCHSTRLAGSSSRTFMSIPPAPKRNLSTPPTTSPSPCVSFVHQAERPSRVVNALWASFRDDDLIPTLCKILTICDSACSSVQVQLGRLRHGKGVNQRRRGEPAILRPDRGCNATRRGQAVSSRKEGIKSPSEGSRQIGVGVEFSRPLTPTQSSPAASR